MCLNECTKHDGNVKIKWTTFHWRKKEKKKKERKKEIWSIQLLATSFVHHSFIPPSPTHTINM